MVDANTTAILITGIVALIPISIISVIKIPNHRLRMEQIKAETVIKTEEIRAKNRLDIEKLMVQDSTETIPGRKNRSFEISNEDDVIKKVKLNK